MPKTATRQKTATEADKISGNGSNKTAAQKAEDKNQLTDTVDVKEAQAEYNKRKKTQLGLIKKTDKELLRAMLYQMVLGRVFEQKCAEVYRIGKIGGFCHL